MNCCRKFLRAGICCHALVVGIMVSFLTAAAQTPTAPRDAQAAAYDAARLKAVAEFTQKMKDANYPALFDKAAKEFNVPPDVLKGVAFAETRWSQLEWPPGETASPETGMPRPYGIMSLMDNEYFGHSLQEAAKLIGQDPDVLKTDAFQNMRGGAALLRQLYESTPKPADAQGDEIESWRKAIVKYCGIPQPELSESHALKVYEFMNMGYHDYGIEWPAHPVNLEPMRAEVARIRAEARARLEAKMKTELAQESNAAPTNISTQSLPPAPITSPAFTNSSAPSPEKKTAEPIHAESGQRGLLLGLIIVLLAIGAIYIWKRRGKTE